MLLLYSSVVRDVKEVSGSEATSVTKYLFPASSIAAAVLGAVTASTYRLHDFFYGKMHSTLRLYISQKCNWNIEWAFLYFTLGVLVSKINKWLLLSIAMFLMATGSLVLPFCVDVSVMTIGLVLMGLAMGLFDAGKFKKSILKYVYPFISSSV